MRPAFIDFEKSPLPPMSQKKRPRTKNHQHHHQPLANKSSNDTRPKSTMPVIKSIRRSIFSIGATHKHTQSQQHIYTTEYFRSVNPSLFFETTLVTNNCAAIFDAIASQFSSSPPLVVQLRFKDKRIVVEITPKDEHQRAVLSSTGLIIKGKTIMGTPALRKGSGFLSINLYDLPHVPEQEFIRTIHSMLQPYGNILDISLFLSTPHNFLWVKRACF